MLDQLVSVYDAWSKGGRALDLEQLAMENEFKFSKREPLGEQMSRIKGFELTKKKGSSRLLGILEGEMIDGEGVLRAYDFMRTQDLETYTTTVIEICSDIVSVDYFKIVPRGFMSGAKKLFKKYPKPFPNNKAFHKQFFVESKSIHLESTLNPAIMDLMMEEPKLTVEGYGSFFIFYKRHKTLPVLDIMPKVAFAEEFISLLSQGERSGYV